MVSYFNEHAQLFYAIEKKEGRVYLGYAPDRSEAEAYCFELVEERKKCDFNQPELGDFMWHPETLALIYDAFDDMEKHEILNLDSYIHITSPIRRLVDLLNIIQFQDNNKLVAFTDRSKAFYDKWMSRISYINTTMRSIRRVQCDCSLLDLCVNKPEFIWQDCYNSNFEFGFNEQLKRNKNIKK